MTKDSILQSLTLDERNNVEKPFLDQIPGLGWEIIDLDSKQHEKSEGIR
jgi:type I restriction enzyme, R subunit